MGVINSGSSNPGYLTILPESGVQYRGSIYNREFLEICRFHRSLHYPFVHGALEDGDMIKSC